MPTRAHPPTHPAVPRRIFYPPKLTSTSTQEERDLNNGTLNPWKYKNCSEQALTVTTGRHLRSATLPLRIP